MNYRPEHLSTTQLVSFLRCFSYYQSQISRGQYGIMNPKDVLGFGEDIFIQEWLRRQGGT